MTQHERLLIGQLATRIQRLLQGELPTEPLKIPEVAPELTNLTAQVLRLQEVLNEAGQFLTALSRGLLDQEPPPRNNLIAPFKMLHAHLRHLTWQTQQIASGDLDQQVDFMGEFSIAFNRLIDSLREKRETEERIRFLSFHDPLTGLYNRAYFQEELERLVQGRHLPMSLLMADIDGLKHINDTLGHEAGDQLIRQAGQLLLEAVRRDDVVARIGGDEFAVILPETDEPLCAAILQRIRTVEPVIRQSYPEFANGISLGAATARCHQDLTTALRTADQRMYQDKAARKAASAPHKSLIKPRP